MPIKNRELTGREKQRIKKLIVSLCANYDKEYGCLSLDRECPKMCIRDSRLSYRASSHFVHRVSLSRHQV